MSKKEYLLSSKKCFLIEDKLLPLYSHLVESYSDQLKDTWEVKVEESQFGSVLIKEEPTDEINYDAPMILQMHEVCFNFPPVASCLKHFGFFPYQKLMPNARINVKHFFSLSYWQKFNESARSGLEYKF